MEIVKNLLVKNKAGEVGVVTGIGSIYFTVTFPHKEVKYGYEAFGMRYLVPVKASPIKVQKSFENDEYEECLNTCMAGMAGFSEMDYGNDLKSDLPSVTYCEIEDDADSSEPSPYGYDFSDEHDVILLRDLGTQPKKDAFAYVKHCACAHEFSKVYQSGRVSHSLCKDEYLDGGFYYGWLGPVVDEASGLSCPNLQTYWELSKVFDIFDKNGKPSKEYFAYREGFLKKEKYRQGELKFPWKSLKVRPWGSSQDKINHVAYYAYFDKKTKKWKMLGEIEAKKKILIPLYVKLMSESPLYQELLELMEDGERIALIGEDVFNYYSKKAKEDYRRHCQYVRTIYPDFPVPSSKELGAVNSFKDFVNLPSPLGAASILKAMLDGELSYENGEIKDPHHILSISKKKKRK